MNNTLTRITTPIRKQAGADRPRMIISPAPSTATRTTWSREAGDFSAATRGNLPLVWGHDYKQMPIGQGDPGLARRRRQHPRGMELAGKRSARGPRQKRLEPRDHYRASIGFHPKDSQRNKEGGYDHHVWELLEVSLCVVPSNREAVRELKALGLWSDRKEPMQSERD